MTSTLTKNQKKIIEVVKNNKILDIEIRFDDECNNGYNTFAITGTLWEGRRTPRTESTVIACGCIHDEIAKLAPEYAHLIKWHLWSTDGPIHGAANALYHVSDRDTWGLKKGEPGKYKHFIRFQTVPYTLKQFNTLQIEWLLCLTKAQINGLEIVEDTHNEDPKLYKTKYTIHAPGVGPMPAKNGLDRTWYRCPFDTLTEAQEFIECAKKYGFETVERPTIIGEGKERDLQAARECVNWPDAPDSLWDLPKDELKIELENHITKQMALFRADVEALGFTW